MARKNLARFTLANGHPGNNLVRLLIKKGVPIISKAEHELGFDPKKPKVAVREAMIYLYNKHIDKKQFSNKLLTLIIFFSIASTAVSGQNLKSGKAPAKVSTSVETDPAFWVGTLPNGVGFDVNLDFRLAKQEHLRFGILCYSGTWSGSLGKSILLTQDFTETNWIMQWNGLGIEAQYQFRMGLKRGGLQPGLRLQWNQFIYRQTNLKRGEANHVVLTPQLGFQWFPFPKAGLYVLPWAGVQIPAIGTENIMIDGTERDTRKVMPIVTAHIGWEFKF